MLKQDSIRIMGQAKYNESLAVKFTNLTKTQKETLQQMFAYMQKCTAVGANRCIRFFGMQVGV